MKSNQKVKFSKPEVKLDSLSYLKDVILSGHHHGDGKYTKLCQQFFEKRYDVKKALLTTSCTDALEMAAILLDIKAGDEVIVPSYTFVSTVLPFLQRGAKLIFVDSSTENPNIDLNLVTNAMSERTKAIVVVHYAGVAVDMDRLLEIAGDIPIVEDAAHALDSTYKGRQLGSIGALGTFSFHSTKNISCGEGGMLLVNDECYIERAEIIREKGTNRAVFFQGKIDKYGWVDLGSSFLPSEFNAAILYSQINIIDEIQQNRKLVWEAYDKELKRICSCKDDFSMSTIPIYADNNAHMYYIVTKHHSIRSKIINALSTANIDATFHYQSLHASPYAKQIGIDVNLPRADHYSNNLLRFPLYPSLPTEIITRIAKILNELTE